MRKNSFHVINQLTDCRILSIPFGPNVVFTKSAMAIAPTNEDILAFSPYVTKDKWFSGFICPKKVTFAISASAATTPSADILDYRLIERCFDFLLLDELYGELL